MVEEKKQVKKTRAQIKQELLLAADEIWSHWDDATEAMREDEIGYLAKTYYGEDNIPAVMTKYRVEGLTMEKWQDWVADPATHACTVNCKLTRVDLPEDEGHESVILKMALPFIFTNRSSVLTFYRHELEDGTGLTMSSSLGNEEFFETHADKIDGDVITNNVVNYCSYKAYEGGVELAQITKMDCMGMIPDFVKSIIAGRTSGNLKYLVALIKDGIVPEAPF